MEQAGVVLELFISAGNPPRVSFPEAYGLRHVAFRVEDATAARETLRIEPHRAPGAASRYLHRGRHVLRDGSRR